MGKQTSEVTDLEILIEVEGGEKFMIDLSTEDKKLILASINNLFKGEIKLLSWRDVKAIVATDDDSKD
jgi:hypothetical protein